MTTPHCPTRLLDAVLALQAAIRSGVGIAEARDTISARFRDNPDIGLRFIEKIEEEARAGDPTADEEVATSVQ